MTEEQYAAAIKGAERLCAKEKRKALENLAVIAIAAAADALLWWWLLVP